MVVQLLKHIRLINKRLVFVQVPLDLKHLKIKIGILNHKIYLYLNPKMSKHNEISSFIWNVCDDVLRGLFKQHEYGDVILPFVVLRRLDCVLEGKKDEIISTYEQYKSNIDSVDRIVQTRLNLNFSIIQNMI